MSEKSKNWPHSRSQHPPCPLKLRSPYERNLPLPGQFQSVHLIAASPLEIPTAHELRDKHCPRASSPTCKMNATESGVLPSSEHPCNRELLPTPLWGPLQSACCFPQKVLPFFFGGHTLPIFRVHSQAVSLGEIFLTSGSAYFLCYTPPNSLILVTPNPAFSYLSI